MAKRDGQKPGQHAEQTEESRQSGQQGTPKSQGGRPGAGQESGAGIGSSQGQDRASPREQQKPGRSSGTADVERGTQSGASESMVDDMTGAYKERP